MIAIQIGIIIFLGFILVIVYQDEYRRRKLARKSVRSDRFWDGKERRKSIRINTEIDVLYEPTSGKRSVRRNSVSKNLSAGGINLQLSEKLFPGTILNLQLNIPNCPRPIFVRGEIVWIKELAEDSSQKEGQRLFATGIKFVQTKSEDDALLRNFINQRVKEAPEQITPYT